MANPITKILHFAEEIQNVHSAGSPIEVTECDPTPTPTPEEHDNYIEINYSTTDNVQIGINQGYSENDTQTVENGFTDTRRVIVSDGIGEDTVYEADGVVNIWYDKSYSDTIERKIVIKGYVGKFTLNTATKLKVKSVIIKSSRIDTLQNVFSGCSNMEICDLSEFDTSNVKSFQRAFYSCSSLTSLDVSHFNLSGILPFVTPFQYTFYGCSLITNSGIDFSNWSVDTICVEDTTGFRQNAGFTNEPAWNENCTTPTPTPEQATPTPIPQLEPTPTPLDQTPTPTNGNGGTGNNGGTGGGDGNLSSPPIVGVRGEYCTSDTTPTWTIDYDTNYPTPIEYEVKIGSSGNVVTITEQTYTSPEELPHGNHTFYVRGKSSQNLWSTWSDFTTEVRTHMPNVPVLYHEKSHARYGSTQAINSWPTWTGWGWYQVSDVGDDIGYGIKVNDEDEHLIGPGTTNMDGQMWYGRDKDSLGIGTHKVKVRARDCAGNWSDYSNEVTFTITEAEQNPVTETNCILPRDSRNWELVDQIQGSHNSAEVNHTVMNYDGSVLATVEFNINYSEEIDRGVVRNREHIKVFHLKDGEYVQKGNSIQYLSNAENYPYDGYYRYYDTHGRWIQISADGNVIALYRAVFDYKDANGITVNNAGGIMLFKYNGSEWNQYGQIILGTSNYEQRGEFFKLSADGTRFLEIPKGGGYQVYERNTWNLYEYNEDSNLWENISSFNINELGIENNALRHHKVTSDLKTLTCTEYVSPELNTGDTFDKVRIFRYDEENKTWTDIGIVDINIPTTSWFQTKGISDDGKSILCEYLSTDNHRVIFNLNYVEGNWIKTELSNYEFTNPPAGLNGFYNNYSDFLNRSKPSNNNATRFIEHITGNSTDSFQIVDKVGTCWQKIGSAVNIGDYRDHITMSGNGKVVSVTQEDYPNSGGPGRILIYSHPSESLPSEFPTLAEEPTPTPTEAPSSGGDDTLASTTSTLEAAAGTKVIEIPDSDTSKFSANMEIVIAPDDDTKREENVIDSIGSLYLKNALQNTHLVGTRIVEKTTSNNEDDPTPTPTQVGSEAPVECPDGQHPEWKLPNGDSCNPSVATLKTFFGLSMNLNNVWENVFDGLSIKFGEQETANGVDYLPIYAKVDNDKMALSSGNNISEWNKLFIFVGDNKSPNNHANGEGIEFDTIISDDLMLLEQHTNSISAKIHFRFANINGIPTLQVKNILKPTNSAFENRDTENDWSSVYVGLGYNLNDDVWPTASVDVNYEIGPMTYSSTDCQEYCVDDPTPTPVDYIEGGGT